MLMLSGESTGTSWPVSVLFQALIRVVTREATSENSPST